MVIRCTFSHTEDANDFGSLNDPKSTIDTVISKDALKRNSAIDAAESITRSLSTNFMTLDAPPAWPTESSEQVA